MLKLEAIRPCQDQFAKDNILLTCGDIHLHRTSTQTAPCDPGALSQDKMI